MTFLKQNWFKLTAVAFLVVFVAGFLYLVYTVTKPSPSQELKSNLEQKIFYENSPEITPDPNNPMIKLRDEIEARLRKLRE